MNGFLDEIKPIAEEKNASLAQLVIRWTLNRPAMSCVLVGARNEKQAADNAKAAEIELSNEEMEQINNALSKVELQDKQ